MKYIYLIISTLFILNSCASIPKETVDMSVQLEQQISVLKQANESIINSVFESKEQQMITYINDKLFPQYINDLFENPDIYNTWNEMLNSNNVDDRNKMMVWFTTNIHDQYRETTDSLLLPIKEEKLRVLKAFNDEFDSAIRMNNTITRNIGSANAIQEASREIVSKVFDINKLDSVIYKSLNRIDINLNSIKK